MPGVSMALIVPLLPPRASTLAGEVDRLTFFAVGMSIAFSLLIAGLLVTFFVRYRRRSPSQVGMPTGHSLALEATWIAIPLAVALFLFVWGARVYFALFRPPAGAVEYWAVGRQWMWKFQHPEGKREINELHVPVGVPIKLTMTSEDVIHSFFVPAFRVKMDVLPGRYTAAWFEATRPGRYHLFCAEYCGAEHSRMGGWVTVLEPHAYEEWLERAGAGETLVGSGEAIFAERACVTCHRPDSAVRAPQLAGLFGRTVTLRGGRTLEADESYLRESILDPAAKVVAGYEPVMPTFRGQVSEEELVQLLSYIKSLGRAAPTAGGAAPAAGGAAPEERR